MAIVRQNKKKDYFNGLCTESKNIFKNTYHLKKYGSVIIEMFCFVTVLFF